ncbi:hypothetical protein CRI93_01670 [Longimonas halophila]|uniref:DUF1641 domain-containing protein n=1 Tax=Longimonas halophila TaxID=1469170 RepID=A0A2H3NQB2_9BACT|nr:DUF1641 domain-containing protein [Longimonas halophila]PEN09461.1 hypothetical protein CRI93_01670 [Longimonas halophila]
MSTPSANGAASLEERLNDPQTTKALHRILDRLDAIEDAVDGLATAVDQAPQAANMVTDMVDDGYRTAEAHGVDLDERMHLALQLTERLTAPKTVETLTRLMNRMDDVDRLIDLADQAPQAANMLVDMFDDAYRAAEASGHDPELVLRRTAEALSELSAFVGSDEFTALKDSGILDPQAVSVVGKAGDALADCRRECGDEPPQVGLWGLFKALRDPDTRRALGFLTSFGKHFGRKLQS